MSKRVLVGISTYAGMKYCFRRFIDSTKSFSYKNYDILVVDNSEGNEFFEEMKKENGIIVIKDEVNEKQKQLRLLSSENKILDYAVENNYDYILKLDSDVIPPKNVIEELLSCKKDIVSAIAFSYFPVDKVTKILPIVWASIGNEEFKEMKKNYPSLSVKNASDIRRHLTKKEVDSNKLLEVCVPFNGCMLISKKVFEKCRYGIIETAKKNSYTGDIYFFNKAKELGFKMFCYTKLKCDHMVGGKYKFGEDGKIINPLFEHEI